MEMDPRLEVMASILGMREGGSQYSSVDCWNASARIEQGHSRKNGGGKAAVPKDRDKEQTSK